MSEQIPNRNTMGYETLIIFRSRAGPSLTNNIGKGNNIPQTRLGTKGGFVFIYIIYLRAERLLEELEALLILILLIDQLQEVVLE